MAGECKSGASAPAPIAEFGAWAQDVSVGNPFKSEDATMSNLFWAQNLSGVSGGSLLSIGAGTAAKVLMKLPKMKDIPLETYTRIVKGVKNDSALMALVCKTYAGPLAKTKERLGTLFHATVATEDAARLLLLSVHPRAKEAWNDLMPDSAKVDARTMFTAVQEMNALAYGVTKTTYGQDTPAAKAFLTALVGA